MRRPTASSPLAGAIAAIILAASGALAATLDEARDLHRRGSYPEAAAAYRAALEDPELDAPSRAVAHNNLCLVLDALGELAAAERACHAALELRRGLGDDLRLARTLNNLGLVLQHLGRYAEAERRFSEALAINRDLAEPRAQAVNLSNLGALATLSGRFQAALEWHRAVSALARDHREEPWAGEQSRIARLNRAVVLERLSAYREALDEYTALLAERELLTPEQEAAVLMNSGVVYRNLGDPVRAIERFQEARGAYRRAGDVAGLAHTELNIGIARLRNLGDTAGAEASIRRALDRVRESGDRAVEIEALIFLGELTLSENRAAEARVRFEEALALARDSGSAEGAWASLSGLGQAERSQGRLEAALGHFEAAIASIEQERAEVARADYRAAFFADKRAVYAGALETLALMDRDDGGFAGRALEVAQQAKARDLLDSLRMGGGDLRRGFGVRSLAAADVVRRLGDDLLIEYFVTDAELLLWWNERGALRLASLGEPGPILEAVTRAHRALSHGSEPPAALLAELAARLLGPVAPLLDRAGSVWIAPDRRLHYLPFELLPLPRAPGGRLIDRARVTYLPSAWALPEPAARRLRRPAEIGFLGLGGVDFGGESPYPSWVSGLALAPLTAARRELESAARRVPGEHSLLLGSAATEGALRAYAGRSARVLHFATHTTLAEGRGQGSAILLTPGDGDDGLLLPEEIASHPIRAGLVVLAACTTALGGRDDGRALTTLTGSFLATGSDAVLATLWPVGDQPTAVFMDQFYYQLAKGMAPAEALRRTKLRMLADERWRRPGLWSGYVLVGSAAPVAPRGLPWLALAAGALALIALAFVWARRPNRAAGRRAASRRPGPGRLRGTRAPHSIRNDDR